MKSRLNFYPVLRREFENMQELADVINKSRRYVQNRLNGNAAFTNNEKRLIAEYLKPLLTEEETKKLFVRSL